MSSIETDTKALNTIIVTRAYNRQIALSNTYKQIGDRFGTHKILLLELIDQSQTRATVDDTILKQLDDGVELLIKSIDTILHIPQDQTSGLGSSLVPQLTSPDTDLSGIILPIPLNSKNSITIAGFKLPIPAGISVFVALSPPVISLKYDNSNIGSTPSLSSFGFSTSTNINGDLSVVTDPSGNVFPTVDAFKIEMDNEIIKLASISKIFYQEQTRIHNLAINFMALAIQLAIIDAI
jgi:hypothetical protein